MKNMMTYLLKYFNILHSVEEVMTAIFISVFYLDTLNVTALQKLELQCSFERKIAPCQCLHLYFSSILSQDLFLNF